jgi:ABC-type transporter Mla subunit MlaD
VIVSRREKVRVGIFLVVAAALIVAVALALAGLSTKPVVKYASTFEESISGLNEAADVRYQGKKVGKVTRIGIDVESFLPLVDYEVYQEFQHAIREDTVATLVVQGYATGLRMIELARGSPKSPVRAPGTRIPSKLSTFADLDSVRIKAEEALVAGRDVLRSVNTAVVKVTARIDPTLDGVNRSIGALERTLGEGEGLISENRPGVREAVAGLKEAISTFREVADKAKTDDLSGKLAQALERLTASADALGRVADRVDRLLGRNSEAIEEILLNMRTTSRNLAEAAREIKERPALLLRDLERGRRDIPD